MSRRKSRGGRRLWHAGEHRELCVWVADLPTCLHSCVRSSRGAVLLAKLLRASSLPRLVPASLHCANRSGCTRAPREAAAVFWWMTGSTWNSGGAAGVARSLRIPSSPGFSAAPRIHPGNDWARLLYCPWYMSSFKTRALLHEEDHAWILLYIITINNKRLWWAVGKNKMCNRDYALPHQSTWPKCLHCHVGWEKWVVDLLRCASVAAAFSLRSAQWSHPPLL